ncbi:MAG: RsmE family RNA methyltransferase [Chitinophagaceae bacterium]
MSAPYFYEPQINLGATSFTCSEETSKHCAQVLRMQGGDAIQITNGMGGIFEATIVEAHKKNTTVQINKEYAVASASQKIILGISILKNAVRLEWLFEKATEMGVHTIVPLLCERTIHERFKSDRMNNIIQSAMIQSQQAWLPYLSEPIPYKEFIHQYNATVKYIAHCEPTVKTSIKDLPQSKELMIAIGPEGDFTMQEIEMAMQAQFQPIGLGPTRLRTETAGLFALSVLKTF